MGNKVLPLASLAFSPYAVKTLQAEIKGEINMKKCPSCQIQFWISNQTTCPKCNTKLVEAEKQETQTWNICRFCGHEFRADQHDRHAKCPQCHQNQ